MPAWLGYLVFSAAVVAAFAYLLISASAEDDDAPERHEHVDPDTEYERGRNGHG